ncbi:MAG: MoxR family ATPase [Polyangia bacterium]|jgi:MoxR-like ATPase|nr:MoxR family ATPase [Polyangia bacterium]
MEIQDVSRLFQTATREIGKVIVGQAELVEGTLTALFCEGHVLIEGVPGLGKTLLVNTLARTFAGHFRRVQFTPDLMPSDLTGHNVYDLAERKFHFNAGPVFTNLLLADEINRSPPKTQSALLEVMQERQVTVDGQPYLLQPPFQVLATQNPIEHEGTYPLPEAQVDRFMFKLMVHYPSQEEEDAILGHFAAGRDTRNLDDFGIAPVMKPEDIPAVQKAVAKVIVEPKIIHYITSIVARTRQWHAVSVGSSPRGGIAMLVASRTMAACQGRNYVIPDDVKLMARWVLRHRLILRPEAEIEGITADAVVGEILDTVEVPRQ